MLTAFIIRRQPMFQLVNLAHKFSLFSEQWQPKVVAEMNDYQFKVVRIAGDFIWHSHPETDETLMVVEGIARGLPRRACAGEGRGDDRRAARGGT